MEVKTMKLFNFIIILLVIFLTCCTKEKNDKTKPSRGISENDTVTATLEYNSGLLPKSPFYVDSVVVIEKVHLKFYNNTEYGATFIIPNSDKLFEKNMGYDSLTDTLSNVQYLFIPVQNGKHSKPLKINKNANPDTSKSAIYPYSIFCQNGTQTAEMHSSPIIIVKP
jgi:hypothetical protein